MTAHTLLVLVSDPLDRVPNTEITPSSTNLNLTDFKSARLHIAAAHICLTLAVDVDDNCINALITFSING
jgi:hypothetical protein